MKASCLTLVLFTLLASITSSKATVTLGLQADELRNDSGTAIGPTSLFLLVSSTTDGIFDSLTADSSTAIGSLIAGTDDRIVFRGDLQSSFANYGGNGALDVTASGLDLSSVSGWSQGDKLALLWFPTLTTASSTIPAGAKYGLYTDAVGIDGSAIWATPADGGTVNLAFYTSGGATIGSGSNPASAGNASFTVAPEPSRMMLGLFGILGLAFRRRR